MQIPVLNGIYTNNTPDFRTSYPRNLVPVPKQQGISNGYLKPAEGIVQFGTGGGVDRGGINWDGVCYRVMGGDLVSINGEGNVVTIGSVGGTGQVIFDYSFDYLAVMSGGKLFLYDGSTLAQITDVDLGVVVDFIWIDGYFLTTDGENLVVTELTDPFSVNPLKYGSSETDPDPINAIVKIRNEAYVINRHTIEVFDNIGGDFFPFGRIEGAQIQKGSLGTHCCCVFLDSIVFVGSGRNEQIAIYIVSSGNSVKISTREIDLTLAEFTEAQLANVVLESRVYNGHEHLWIRLPDRTVVFDANASKELGEQVWFTLTSSLIGNDQYRAQNLVYCYNKWLVGDPKSNNHGYLSDDDYRHWGELVGWDFGTIIVYNEGRGAIFKSLELMCLSGRTELGADPSIWTQYSLDGVEWSQERAIRAGKQGQRAKRLVWFQCGTMHNWRIQRFRGTSDSKLVIARLEAELEELLV